MVENYKTWRNFVSISQKNYTLHFIIIFDEIRYALFDPEAMIDNRERSITFSAVSNTTVAATLPHFWRYAGIFIFLYYFYIIFIFFSQMNLILGIRHGSSLQRAFRT